MSGIFSKSNEYCARHLMVAYRAYLAHGFSKSAMVDSLVGDIEIFDENISENDALKAIFSHSCCGYMLDLFVICLHDLAKSDNIDKTYYLEALECLQTIFSTALWVSKAELPPLIESFTRDFDRLDMLSEQERLIEVANLISNGGWPNNWPNTKER
jgi:hypothetical protein